MPRANRAACVGAVIVAATFGCKKRQDGLPPASEWHAAQEAEPSEAPFSPPSGMASGRGNPHGMGGAGDPHAGLSLGDPGDPHAGLDMNDPHAGLDMSDPHAGIDVTKLGLAPPDPDRAIDASRRVTGTIVVDAKAKDRMKPGTSVFLIVKRAGPDGAASGPPLAVDKLSWSPGGVAFELTEAQAMTAGTELTGDVVVMARYDQDSDALSKEPGDVTGQVRVKIPADNVKLALDTILP